MMRAQPRRQSREREAAQMNTLQDDPGADLAPVAPVLDEAIMSLGMEDRTALNRPNQGASEAPRRRRTTAKSRAGTNEDGKHQGRGSSLSP